MAALVALVLSLGLGVRALGPALWAPDAWLVGSWMHPDCLSNHWLLAWVADRVSAGEGILHNPDYYWPVGDAPVLAGNGTAGFAYLPFHWLWGWPAGVPPYLLASMALSGMGAYALGRAAGAGPWASLLLPALAVGSPFVCTELSAGRFSQADTGPLLWFCASWLALLARPRLWRALVSAALLALTSFFYWYYGLFGVIFGGVVLLSRGREGPGLRPLLTFAAGFVVLIGPWLWLSAAAWSGIPGTDELAAFPPAEAVRDAADLTWPWAATGDRAAGTAVPLPIVVLGGLGLGLGLGSRARGSSGGGARPRAGLGVALVLFVLLSLGPAFPGAPYTLLYGLAPPLRRFWWPLRHVVLAVPLLGVFAALALTALRDRWGRRSPRAAPLLLGIAALGLALAMPASLDAQGVPTRVPLTAVRLPPPVYPELAARAPGVLFEPPLSPELSGTQQHLLYQRWHGHALLTGHAPWVARVRPAAWDRFVAENSFLAAAQALERGQLGDAPFAFEAADLAALRDGGLRTVTLNRATLPLKAKPLVRAYAALFDALFGAPIARAPGVWAWDVGAWDGHTRVVALPPWRWPADLGRGGPEAPLVARRPRSQVFERPAGSLPAR